MPTYDQTHLGVESPIHPANLVFDDLDASEQLAKVNDRVIVEIAGVRYEGIVDEIVDGKYVFWDEKNQIERWFADDDIISVTPKKI